MVSVSVVDATVSELGTDTGQFKVTCMPTVTKNLSVRYTVSGSASNGVDYVSLSGTVIIPAGATGVLIPITPKDDTLKEGTEMVSLTLTAQPAYQLGTSNSKMSIVDND